MSNVLRFPDRYFKRNYVVETFVTPTGYDVRVYEGTINVATIAPDVYVTTQISAMSAEDALQKVYPSSFTGEVA